MPIHALKLAHRGYVMVNGQITMSETRRISSRARRSKRLTQGERAHERVAFYSFKSLRQAVHVLELSLIVGYKHEVGERGHPAIKR